MKLLVFCAREDESYLYEEYNLRYRFEIEFTKKCLTVENAKMAEGFDAVVILTSCRIDRTLAFLLMQDGVKYILSRAAGTDHLDLTAIEEAGLAVANVPFYPPESIAEHTVMLMLMLLRHMKREMKMIGACNFTMDGLKGRTLKNLTVGIFGFGRIGRTVAEILRGFGCRKVLAYSRHTTSKIPSDVQFVSREELFLQSDILSFHCPLTSETAHILSHDSMEHLKNGVLLVNTARGGLFDYSAVLERMKAGKIGGLAMDVFEDEAQFIRKNMAGYGPENFVLQELLNMENVIFTAHIGFYTEESVAAMVATSLRNLYEMSVLEKCGNQLTNAGK